jgi:hypothetical protein
MSSFLARLADGGLGAALAVASRCGSAAVDYRAAVCRFEDDLFKAFPAGHRLMELAEAEAMIGPIFAACGLRAPALTLVAGFDDPRVGGFADLARHRIAIERGYLYRFLVLHESAHFIVPQDRLHGPGFLYVLQLLYRDVIGVPEDATRRYLRKHALPPVADIAVPLAA